MQFALWPRKENLLRQEQAKKQARGIVFDPQSEHLDQETESSSVITKMGKNKAKPRNQAAYSYKEMAKQQAKEGKTEQSLDEALEREGFFEIDRDAMRRNRLREYKKKLGNTF